MLQENDNIHVLIYTGCRLRSGKINYVVTHENGNVVSWGQEYLPEYNASVPVVAVNLRFITSSLLQSYYLFHTKEFVPQN